MKAQSNCFYSILVLAVFLLTGVDSHAQDNKIVKDYR